MMKILFFILFVILLCFNVNSISVVSDRLENDILLLEDGTSKLYGIRLQNADSNEIQLQLTYDKTIAKVIDYQEMYTVPPKESKPIYFNISAPTNSKPDDLYTVSYTVHDLSGGGTGLSISLKINKDFKVKIIKDPNKFYLSDYYKHIPRIIIILAILAILFKKDWIMSTFFKNMPKKRKVIKWKS